MTTLVAVCGRTPQVVTETLWGLAKEGGFPRRVVILTTAGSRPDVERRLLGEDGRIASLARILGLEAPEVELRSTSASDISHGGDADEFLELAMNAAQEATAAEDSRTVFSVAGGRKTMSVALTLAAQCYARKDDELLHTLVSEEHESSDFFHPVPGTASESVPVTLVRMPFFKMRGRLLPESLTAASTREIADAFSGAPCLEIDISRRTVGIAGTKTAFSPALFAVYLFFILRRTCPPKAGRACPEDCTRCSLSAAEIVDNAADIARLYDYLSGSGRSRGGRGIESLSAESFLSYRSLVNDRLVKEFGEIGGRIGIVRIGRRRKGRYCVRIPRDGVAFTDKTATVMLRSLFRS